jgi:translocation and assembly module TamB
LADRPGDCYRRSRHHPTAPDYPYRPWQGRRLGGMVPYLQNVKKLSMIDKIKLETESLFDTFSLVFGSWLTPGFYVSYWKIFLKESGSFNTRYTIGKGFYFTTETRAAQSGGDVKYEFED